MAKDWQRRRLWWTLNFSWWQRFAMWGFSAWFSSFVAALGRGTWGKKVEGILRDFETIKIEDFIDQNRPNTLMSHLQHRCMRTEAMSLRKKISQAGTRTFQLIKDRSMFNEITCTQWQVITQCLPTHFPQAWQLMWMLLWICTIWLMEKQARLGFWARILMTPQVQGLMAVIVLFRKTCKKNATT